MKPTILVAGPRSSGTRLMTRILVESGCFGDFTHHQRMDAFDRGFPLLNREMPEYSIAEILEESKPYEYAVIRRSFPHGCGWPDVADLRDSLHGRGFRLDTAFWMFRNREANAQSMFKRGHTRSLNDASDSIDEATARISGILRAGLDLYAIHFARLRELEYVQSIFRRANIALNPKNDFVFDADAKHFNGQTEP